MTAVPILTLKDFGVGCQCVCIKNHPHDVPVCVSDGHRICQSCRDAIDPRIAATGDDQ